MNVDLLEMMSSFFMTLGIQVQLLKPPYSSLSDMDFGFRSRLYEGFDYDVLFRQFEHICEPESVMSIKDDFHLFYTVFHFSDALKNEYGYEYCMIGPYLFQPMSVVELQRLMLKKKIPSGLYKEAGVFFDRIPLISFYEQWNLMMRVFCTRLLGEGIHMRYAVSNEYNLLESDIEYRLHTTPEIAASAIVECYKEEEEMMKAVAAGNARLAAEMYHKLIQYKISPRTPDLLRNQKNLMIVLNTLLRKAAQIGYVHPLHIDNLSSQIAIQIESTTNLTELTILTERMIRKYCMLVQNFSRKPYSALVQTCMDYIDFHYVEELSLDSMARMCSVSNSYLSALFKKEVKMTLTDYLNSTRIRQSLILLNSTAYSIQDIAVLCGFSTANYFARMFKKHQGQAPKEYREGIRG